MENYLHEFDINCNMFNQQLKNFNKNMPPKAQLESIEEIKIISKNLEKILKNIGDEFIIISSTKRQDYKGIVFIIN